MDILMAGLLCQSLKFLAIMSNESYELAEAYLVGTGVSFGMLAEELP